MDKVDLKGFVSTTVVASASAQESYNWKDIGDL